MSHLAHYLTYIIGVTLGLFLFTVIGLQSFFPKWVKWVFGIYYLFPIAVLQYLQNQLAEKWYATTPVPDQFWDENSKLANIFAGLFFIPLCLLFITLYYNWFKQMKSTYHRVLLGLSILPILVFGFIVFFMFVFTYGYQP